MNRLTTVRNATLKTMIIKPPFIVKNIYTVWPARMNPRSYSVDKEPFDQPSNREVHCTVNGIQFGWYIEADKPHMVDFSVKNVEKYGPPGCAYFNENED